ncbi:replication protein A 70 kDa DNA-binding subunit B [Tanacetum coccineum]
MLDAVADQQLWFWHAYFEVPGANNDLNVLYGSPLFDDLLLDKALEASFVVNRKTYVKGYYLAGGIYPQLSTFVKVFTIARDQKTMKFKRVQESARKDIEKLSESYKIDVIGTIVSISNPIPFSGGLGEEKRRRTIVLEDVDGLQMKCRFFDGWVDRFNILVEQRDIVGHVVLILQIGRVKYFNEVRGYDEKRHTITLWSPTRKRITPKMSGAVKKMVGSIGDSDSIRFIYPLLCYKLQIHKIQREYGWSFLACKKYGRSAKETEDESSSSKTAKFKNKMIEQYKDFTDGTIPDEFKDMVKMIIEDPSMIAMFKKDFYVEHIVIDLEEYDGDESAAKKGKKAMVEVKLEKNDS